MKKQFLCSNVTETEAAGAALAHELLKERVGRLYFICLTGDLGAGKTAFVRGFASVMSPGSRVKSPTYTVVNEYRRGDVPLFHFDLYRLDDGDESLDAIGFDEYTESGHCIIEWSENLSEKPSDTIYVDIKKCDEETRLIKVDF